MLFRKLFRKLGKQYKTPGIGAFKETLSQALWWGVPLNFAMVAGTFYYTTVRHIVVWANPAQFFVALVAVVIIAFVVEYKYIVPSVWSFREKQMFGHKSEVMDELKRFKEEVLYELEQLKTQKEKEEK